MVANSTRSGKEVMVTAPDSIGVLSRISTTISDAHVNIRAICAYEVDGIAHLRLITDDSEKATQALWNAGFDAKESPVIMSEISPHALHPEVAELAGGYQVNNNYWCASAHSGEHALLVFSPLDNVKGTFIS